MKGKLRLINDYNVWEINRSPETKVNILNFLYVLLTFYINRLKKNIKVDLLSKKPEVGITKQVLKVPSE